MILKQHMNDMDQKPVNIVGCFFLVSFICVSWACELPLVFWKVNAHISVFWLRNFADLCAGWSTCH